MTIKMAAALAAVALAASNAAASAYPAITNSKAYLHAGPGVWDQLITLVPAHASVDVRHCGGYWCAVTWTRYAGYMLGSAIGATPRRRGPPAEGYAPNLVPGALAPGPPASVPGPGPAISCDPDYDLTCGGFAYNQDSGNNYPGYGGYGYYGYGFYGRHRHGRGGFAGRTIGPPRLVGPGLAARPALAFHASAAPSIAAHGFGGPRIAFHAAGGGFHGGAPRIGAIGVAHK